MSTPIYVVGHKNPDTDCVVAAIACAELFRLKGEEAIPARQGELRPETAYLLRRFGFPEPILFTDARPRVRDAMSSPAITVSPRTPAYRVGQIFRTRNIRAVPVVDDESRLLGMISVEDFSSLLLEEIDPRFLDQVYLQIEAVVETIGGHFLNRGNRPIRGKVYVGAMSLPRLMEYVEPGSILIIGDREEAQRAAIEKGVGAIIVTGGLPVPPEVLQLAKEHGVTVISSPYHTFTTVRLLLLSTPVQFIMKRDVAQIYEDDLLEDARALLARQRTLPVLDESGRVKGVISRSDLLKAVRYRLILVDHNERSQSVVGLDEAEIVAIIDHHRVGDIQTPNPVMVRSEPVGATSTIVASLFQEHGFRIEPALAGLMLGAIISDTVFFRSPTTTPRDRAVASILASSAGISPENLAEELFSAASEVLNRPAREIIMADFKEYRFDDRLFGIGYLEVHGRGVAEKRRDEFIEELKKLREEKGYTSVMFMLVDILDEETELLVLGKEKEVAEALGVELSGPHSLTLRGIISRKKQIAPILMRL